VERICLEEVIDEPVPPLVGPLLRDRFRSTGSSNVGVAVS